MSKLRLEELTVAKLTVMCEAAGVASLGWRTERQSLNVGEFQAHWVLRHVEVDGVSRVTRCADHVLEETLTRLAHERRGGVVS